MRLRLIFEVTWRIWHGCSNKTYKWGHGQCRPARWWHKLAAGINIQTCGQGHGQHLEAVLWPEMTGQPLVGQDHGLSLTLGEANLMLPDVVENNPPPQRGEPPPPEGLGTTPVGESPPPHGKRVVKKPTQNGLKKTPNWEKPPPPRPKWSTPPPLMGRAPPPPRDGENPQMGKRTPQAPPSTKKKHPPPPLWTKSPPCVTFRFFSRHHPLGCCSYTGPWTVTRSSLRMLRRVAVFCRPLRPVLLLVAFPRSRSPVVGALGLC